ncbi:MAG: RNase adapter RapZ [Deltaproteobacteria bacterium]|nr:RNase adapter RapZ [Deltaproteobacteria bacterium]
MKHPLVIIVTGLSGSGKSTALKVIEDAGFFCMDNIPIDLLMKFVDIYDLASLNMTRIGLGMDVRGGASSFVEKAPDVFTILRDLSGSFRLIFLEAKIETMLNRFKESRRRHPLSDSYPNLVDAIKEEVSIMAPIRSQADYVIDTTDINVHDLASKISDIVSHVDKSRDMYIQVSSFGFKNGLPMDADIVMDVRFLPNPYFVDELKDMTGRHGKVKNFLRSHNSYVQFMNRWKDLIRYVLPLCKEEGRSYLNIAIGCTGGRHRSVAVAEEIKKVIEDAGFSCEIIHRDLG